MLFRKSFLAFSKLQITFQPEDKRQSTKLIAHPSVNLLFVVSERV